MRDKRILEYYNRELRYLRALGAEFADKHKDVAGRLRLEPNRAEDPHVERLLQGVAFLTARVHLRIEDDFPELSQAIFNVVYPHYLRPTPAMSIVQFQGDQGSLTAPRRYPRGTRIISPPTRTGERFRFRTCYETTLRPVEVRDAGWHSPHEISSPVPTDAVAVLRIDLSTGAKASFDDLDLSPLRFHLHGDGALVGNLYELLLNNRTEVVAWDPDRPAGPVLRLPPTSVTPVGFLPDEAMMPETRKTFHPYQLLHDYFAFRQKFHFIDLRGFDEAREQHRQALQSTRAPEEEGEPLFGDRLQLLIYIGAFEGSDRHAELQESVDASTLRLSCTPVVNLYNTSARPIDFTQDRSEYVVSVPEHTDVIAIEHAYALLGNERAEFAPLYGTGHGPDDSQDGLFWFWRREPRDWSQASSSDVYLSFVDLEGATARPGKSDIYADLLCSDGDLPNEAIGAGTVLHLEEEGLPVQVLLAPTRSSQPPVDRIDRRSRARHRQDDRLPTRPLPRPPGGGRQHWRLVSMLSLNHLSLVDEGAEAFREMLRLHDPAADTVGERHIQGIVSVDSMPVQAALHGQHGLSFARGRGVTIHFDEELYTGSGVYLFASVLERFLGMYASINSFTRLTAETRQRSEPLRAWPPRAGLKPLV